MAKTVLQSKTSLTLRGGKRTHDAVTNYQAFYTIAGDTIITGSEGDSPAVELTLGYPLLTATEQANSVSFGHSLQCPEGDHRTLHGINGLVPFFTANQVFYTTTGLRAVDAKTARSLAPTREIGSLQPGHVVYHWSSDKVAYENIVIKSIEASTVTKPKYCISLNGGSNIFHGNGFLLLSVQPDLTVTSVADALSTLPPSQRIKSLQTLHELDPLFQQLGCFGVGCLLEQELSKRQFRLTARPSIKRRPFAQSFTSTRRTFKLDFDGTSNIKLAETDYRLPEVAIFEGVLTIDDIPNLRSHLDSSARTICWTRELEGSWFEHGRVRLFHHGLSGDGAILLSKAPHERSISDAKHAAPIRVTKVHQSDHLLTEGAEDVYDMIVDQDVWPKDQAEKIIPTSPLDFGLIQLEIQTIGGADGLDATIVRVPILDQLCDAINNAFQEDDNPVDVKSLYDSTVNLGGISERAVTVTMKNTSLIAQLADQSLEESLFGLTFSESLGSDIVLPVLFQQFQATVSDDGVRGALYEYDPNMRGCMGQRHLFISSSLQSSSTIKIRAETALAVAVLSPIASDRPKNMTPAPVTDALADFTPLSVQDLLTLDGYDEASIHTAAQSLINNMMLYHMNASDRENILNVPNRPSVPKDLPHVLAEGLQPGLKEWLYEVYAPAFISNQLSEVSPENSKSWRYNFTADEALKIKYWWSGQGRKCLATAKQYSDISELATREAMLRMFPRLSLYMDDGYEWADQAVICLSDYTYLRSLVQTPIEGGVNYANMYSNILATLDGRGVYTDTYFKNMFSYTLSQSFVSPYISTTPTSAVDSKAFLLEAFQNLGVTVLENDPDSELPLDPRMQAELESDILTVEENLGLPSTGSSKQRIQAILGTQTVFVDALSLSMSPFNADWTAGVQQDLAGQAGVGKRVTGQAGLISTVKERGSAAFSWVQSSYNKVTQVLFPDGSPNATLLKGMFAFAMTAKYLYDSIKGFSQWDTDDPVQRSILVFSTLGGVVKIATDVYKTWVAWKAYQFASQKALAQAAMMDQLGDVEMKNVVYKLAEDIEPTTGANPIQNAVSERSSEFGEPQPTDTQSEISFEDPVEAAPDVQLGEEVAAKSFNTTANWLGAASIILNIGMVISLSLQLKEQWNDLNTLGKTLNVINISVMALGIIANQVIADAIVAAGIATAEATMVVALPIIGAVLAVIGVIISILMAVFQTKKPPPPPPLTPVEIFIRDTGKPLVSTWDSQPPERLDYSMPGIISRSGPSPTQFKIMAMNKSGHTMLLSRVTFTFLSGRGDDASLFTNGAFQLVKSSDVSRDNSGNIYTGLDDDIRPAIVANPRSGGATSFNLSIAGISSDYNQSGLLRILPGFGFSVNISGMVAGVGSSLMQIVENLVEPTDNNYKALNILTMN